VSLVELLLKRCLVCVSQFTSAGSAVRKHTPETRHPSLLHSALGMALVTAASIARCLVCVSQFTSAGSAVRKHTPETRHPSLLHSALGMALVTAASIAASFQHGSHAHEAPGC